MRVFFSIVFVLVAFSSNATFGQPLAEVTPESVGISSERLRLIDEAIEREIDAGRMPGAIVAIARQGGLAYFETFGYLDEAAGVPMREDAIFSIASMTKPIFAVAALSLYEEGKLLIDSSIGDYLPELADLHVATDGDPVSTVPARRQPTVRDLMRHTAGYPGGNGASVVHDAFRRLHPGGIDRSLSGPEYLDKLSAIPLYHQPGLVWDYSNGFDLLGLIIERVAEEPVYDVLRERIFEPLGMTDTHFTLPPEKVERQAKPLPIDPLTGAPQTVRDQTTRFGIDCGGGCLAATTSDYLAFAQMLLNRGEFDGARILGSRIVEYMTADHIGPGVDLSRLDLYASLHNEGYGYGLGVAVRRGAGLGGMPGSPGQYHWYGSQGTAFWVDPSEELIVVFMAQTPGDIRERNRQLIPALVYQALMD